MKKTFLFPIALALIGMTACTPPTNSSESKSTRAPRTSIKVEWNVTFDLNYEGAPDASVVTVENKKTVSKPATDPTRSGYKFLGWTWDKNGFTAYNFEEKVTEDVTLYAAWESESETQKNRYTFEAEYAPTALTLDGSTYSGGAKGKACIGYEYDEDNIYASNRFYVHFLYVCYEPERNDGKGYGSKLDFNFTSDKAGTMTVLMRLSAEYGTPDKDITITNDMWKAKLNGTKIDYETLVFKDVPTSGEGIKPFEDYTLGINLPVQAGQNKFEFITDNHELLYGTAGATAPMFDCLKIKSDTTLTWAEANPNQLPEVE